MALPNLPQDRGPSVEGSRSRRSCPRHQESTSRHLPKCHRHQINTKHRHSSQCIHQSTQFFQQTFTSTKANISKNTHTNSKQSRKTNTDITNKYHNQRKFQSRRTNKRKQGNHNIHSQSNHGAKIEFPANPCITRSNHYQRNLARLNSLRLLGVQIKWAPSVHQPLTGLGHGSDGSQLISGTLRISVFRTVETYQYQPHFTGKTRG